MSLAQILPYALVLVVVLLLLRPLLFGGSRITAADAAEQVKAGTAVLIDVREPAEWAGGVAEPAQLLSLSDLKGPRHDWAGVLEQARDKTLVLYCASGMRSGIAAGVLKKEGFQVANMGGFGRWASAGLPVRRP